MEQILVMESSQSLEDLTPYPSNVFPRDILPGVVQHVESEIRSGCPLHIKVDDVGQEIALWHVEEGCFAQWQGVEDVGCTLISCKLQAVKLLVALLLADALPLISVILFRAAMSNTFESRTWVTFP